MQQNVINSLVMAEFYICATKLDFDEINKLLNIPDFNIRRSDSFSVEEFAKDYWGFRIGYDESNDISVQLSGIYEQIKMKVAEINKIREMYNAETGFLITVKQKEVLPAIYFEKKFIKFVAMIGAEVNMDFT